MNRREFASGLSFGALALGLGGSRVSPATVAQVAITMDDFSWANASKLSADERNAAILQTLNAHSLKAALFVVGRNIDNDEGKRLLGVWDKAGHLIGNHTYSHRNYNASETW